MTGVAMDRIDELTGRLDAQRAALAILAAQLEYSRKIDRTQWEADTMALIDALPNNGEALDEMTTLFELVTIFTSENRDRSSGRSAIA